MTPHYVPLTSIGVGGDSDTALLTMLAQLGDGRYYFTERPAEVPKCSRARSSCRCASNITRN